MLIQQGHANYSLLTRFRLASIASTGRTILYQNACKRQATTIWHRSQPILFPLPVRRFTGVRHKHRLLFVCGDRKYILSTNTHTHSESLKGVMKEMRRGSMVSLEDWINIDLNEWDLSQYIKRVIHSHTSSPATMTPKNLSVYKLHLHLYCSTIKFKKTWNRH